MSRHTEKQQDFVSGTVGMARKEQVRPTQFEIQVDNLGLSPEQYISSAELQTWCKANCNTRYIPEHLLRAWSLHTVWDEVAADGEAEVEHTLGDDMAIPVEELLDTDEEPRTTA